MLLVFSSSVFFVAKIQFSQIDLLSCVKIRGSV